jgi:predicted amidohydrolase YtcJ
MKAEAIWFNGNVLTMDPARPSAQALAVARGRILALGSDADIGALADAGTRRYDLRGQALMPGLIDTHAHGVWGALRDLFEVYVGLTSTLPELLAAVRARTQSVPVDQWISGGPWHMAWVADMSQPPCQVLDDAAPHHPVVLRDVTYHTAWLNTAALSACGITRDTPDPQGARIGRDRFGEPDGLLYETAQNLVRPFIASTPAQCQQAVAHMRGYFHRLGLTGFKEAMASELELAAYQEADARGELKLHVAAHLALNSLRSQGHTSVETLRAWRDRYTSAHLHTGFVKMFLDGVAPTLTASFLEPYLPAPGCQPAAHDPDALLAIAPDDLARLVTELDRLGFVVKMHAVGDRAARAGLDAVQAARRSNGPSGLRHEIGHTAFVAAIDHPRFAQLGMVADMSPRLWFPNPVTAGQDRVLGLVRRNRCHQIRSLMDAGAELTYGSDWPAAAADANPWVGLAGMLTRRNPFGLFPGYVGQEQAITLEQALPLFTTNAARAMGLQDVTGALRPGLSADFIRLERSLSACTPEEIAATQVRETWFEGEQVYASEGAVSPNGSGTA